MVSSTEPGVGGFFRSSSFGFTPGEVFDLVGDFQKTSRFVIVDNFDICGGGIVREALKDDQSWVRDKVLVRDYKWIKSALSRAEREEKYCQESSLIFITGKKDEGRKTLARYLE